MANLNGKTVEQTACLSLDFEKLKKVVAGGNNVVPVVVQDAETKEVLILAYVNQEALIHSFKIGKATFWSTSRNEIWIKGETSGSYLELLEIRINCEQNSLLYMVRPRDGACHVKTKRGKFQKSCFYRRILPDGRLFFITE